MLRLIICLFFLGMFQLSNAQKFFTKEGKVRFYSEAPMENIEATNKKLTCVLDTETNAIQFAVLMKGFHFDKALMQEHFNENYVESDKYPKAVFKGNINATAGEEINWGQDGTHNVLVKGEMSIHGETNPVTAEGTIEIQDGKMMASSKFFLTLADYGIEIPSVVVENIAKEVEVTVDLELEPLNQ